MGFGSCRRNKARCHLSLIPQHRPTLSLKPLLGLHHALSISRNYGLIDVHPINPEHGACGTRRFVDLTVPPAKPSVAISRPVKWIRVRSLLSIDLAKWPVHPMSTPSRVAVHCPFAWLNSLRSISSAFALGTTSTSRAPSQIRYIARIAHSPSRHLQGRGPGGPIVIISTPANAILTVTRWARRTTGLAQRGKVTRLKNEIPLQAPVHLIDVWHPPRPNNAGGALDLDEIARPEIFDASGVERDTIAAPSFLPCSLPKNDTSGGLVNGPESSMGDRRGKR
jgi:hypothetical protein